MPVRRPVVLVAGLGLVATTLSAVALTGPSAVATVAPTSAPAQAARAPQVDGVFPLTEEPRQIVAGPDGNMWAVTGGTDDLVRVSPAGVRTYYDVVPGSLGALAVAGPNLWSVTGNGLVKIPVADPTNPTVTPNGDVNDLRGIALGPDGFLWAASDDKVVRFSPGDPAGAVTTTVPGMSAREVVATSTHVWVADATGRVLAFRPDASGTFVTKGVGGTPQGLGAGPLGQVAYSNPGTTPQTVGRVTATTNPSLTTVPDADPSFSIAFGADGAYWVGLFNEQKMLRLTPQGQTRRLFSFAAPYRPRYVARGPDGTIWVSLQDPGNDGAIARISGVRDTTVGVTLTGRRAQVTMRKARVRLACPGVETSGPCRGRVVLRSRTPGRPVLGRTPWSAAVGRTTVVKVPLGRRTVRGIARRGTVVTAVITVRDGAGNARTVRRAVRLVR